MKSLLLIAAVLLAVGCKRTEQYEKGDILAVYMHTPGNYSVLCRQGNELVSKVFPPAAGCENPKGTRIFDDVPPGSNMWFEAHFVEVKEMYSGYIYCDIHIRSHRDISTGGWDHGKGGRGQTVIVEDN